MATKRTIEEPSEAKKPKTVFPPIRPPALGERGQEDRRLHHLQGCHCRQGKAAQEGLQASRPV